MVLLSKISTRLLVFIALKIEMFLKRNDRMVVAANETLFVDVIKMTQSIFVSILKYYFFCCESNGIIFANQAGGKARCSKKGSEATPKTRIDMQKILIIDDEAQITRLLVQNLQTLKHDTLTAQTLNQGLNLAKSEQVDLVFLDLSLPDGNGLDALQCFTDLPAS